MMGALVVCIGGTNIACAEDGELTLSPDYTFYEKGIRDIVIICKDGEKLVIPFSEIVKSLRKEV